jgi:hypothetical protein
MDDDRVRIVTVAKDMRTPNVTLSGREGIDPDFGWDSLPFMWRAGKGARNSATVGTRERLQSVAFCMRQSESNILALREDTGILLASEHFLGKSNII